MKRQHFYLVALFAVAAGMSCTQILGFDKDFEEVDTGATGSGAGGTGAGAGGTGAGVGGAGVGGAGSGGAGGCADGAMEDCYSGAAGTQDVGECKAGTRTCTGGVWGACVGEVVPAPEVCNAAGEIAIDENCDGTLEEGCMCAPGDTRPCYSGPMGTGGIGACIPGTETCNAVGSGWEPCQGEVLPVAEVCATPLDDNCDGQVNEGCPCAPNSTAPCYSGPMGTQMVGICIEGTQTCNAMGTGYGPCQGEVLPATETCNTSEDDDCDGQVNESGAGCICVPNSVSSCYTGPGGTVNVGLCKAGTWTCNAMGTAYGPCQGQVVPVTETCNTTGDDDCDGQVNESGAGCLRLYTRPFPQVGTYTAEWIPAVWTGPNAPPATGILAAELNATAVRLMVWRNNGLYYERYNGVWQPPVSISSHFNNLNGNIIASATVTSAYVFDPNELLIITTNESPPRSITFLIPPAGNPIPDAPLAEIPDEMKPYGPPQHTTPLQWGATEHRWPSPANGDDWIVVWKGLGGTTYQQWAGPNFELYYQPPAPDATGPFQMNGVGSAPQAGTAVAAYYDAVLDRVSFIAP